MGIFKKSGVIVLNKPKPGACGGTTATLDTNAPKEIKSTDMTVFEVTSVLPYMRDVPDAVGYISAFAANSGDGTFLFFETGEGHRRDLRRAGWTYIKENVMPELVALTRECNLAANNGFHSKTHGLPENFGGEIDIRYAGGERISVSNNQQSIISYDTGLRIKEFFESAEKKEKTVLPDVSSLLSVLYEEKGRGNAYKNITLTLNGDGTGTIKKICRYDGEPTVFESEETIDRETVDKIKNTAKEKGVFAWAGLPDGSYSFSYDKRLTFIFRDADSISVKGGKFIPDRLRGGFFDIELELTRTH